MRLLLIDDDARHRALIRHHVTREWPDARVDTHDAAEGRLPPEFLAQGYDAVLLDPSAEGGGLPWLQDLAGRPGFAPVVFLADDTSGDTARRARIFGAFAVVARSRLAHGDFVVLLREASRMQQASLAAWRVSPAAEEARRFGAVRIPHYRCVRRLAGGSLSQLFLAESEREGALVVIKVTPSMRDEAGVDRSFERFLQEYEIARRLSDDRIVRFHELGVADDHAYLTMEYFPDGDLRRRMRAGVTVDEAVALAAQIAGALRALHEAGTLHRDLKPGNVLMRGRDRVALADFGLAKDMATDLEITDPGIIFGTPHYMSPEQGHGQDCDPRADLYSLGVILHEMLTGEKPYTDPNPMAIIYKHRNAPIPRLPAHLAVLQGVVDRLLAKLPGDRYASAAEVEVALGTARLQLREAAA